MLIGYGRPSNVAYTITGTGSAFLSDVVLDNSAPADITLCQWISGSQTTSSLSTIQALWSSAIVPRIACMLGVSLPAGLTVSIKGKRSGDSGFPYGLGGNSQSAVITELPDGSYAVWWVFDAGLTACVGYEITITNNLNGSTVLTASQEYSIGEIGFFQGYQPVRGMQVKWSPGTTNVLNVPTSVNQQPHVVDHRYNRTLDVKFGVDVQLNAFGATPTTMGFNRIAFIAASRQTMAIIPVWKVVNTLDPNMIHTSALFGYGSKVANPQIADASSSNYYDQAIQFTEYPPQQYGWTSARGFQPTG